MTIGKEKLMSLKENDQIHFIHHESHVHAPCFTPVRLEKRWQIPTQLREFAKISRTALKKELIVVEMAILYVVLYIS